MLQRQVIQTIGRGIVLAALLAAAACSGDRAAIPFEPATGDDAAGLYWSLTVNYKSLTLSTVAPHDTVQLIATPRDAKGNPIEGLGPVTFTSDDTTRVVVSPTGLVRAVRPSQESHVVAELSTGNVKHSVDVLIVAVPDSNPPVLAGVYFQPTPPDSATIGMTGDGGGLSIGYGKVQATTVKFVAPPVPFDTAGNPIPMLLAMCESTDEAVIQTFCNPFVTIVAPLRPGHAKLIATATAFGVTKADTVDYTVTMPPYAVVWLKNVPGTLGTTKVALDAAEVTIRKGGTVVWGNLTGAPADIVFDDPSSAAEHGAISCANAGVVDEGGSGDIASFGVEQESTAALSVDNCRSRSFPTPGTYTYHSPLTGVAGKVIVTDASGTP
jgi:hypothetical protein